MLRQTLRTLNACCSTCLLSGHKQTTQLDLDSFTEKMLTWCLWAVYESIPCNVPCKWQRVAFPILHHSIDGVILYSCLIQLLHVSLDEGHVGLLVAKRLLMVLRILAGHCDLEEEESWKEAQDISATHTSNRRAHLITSSSVMSIPITRPLSPTSLLKAKQSLPLPLPRSSTVQPSSFIGNGRPQPKYLKKEQSMGNLHYNYSTHEVLNRESASIEQLCMSKFMCANLMQ